MKTLLSIKVQVFAGLVFFALAYLDAIMNNATNFSELSFIGKTFCCLVMAILAYQVGLLIYSLVKKRKKRYGK